VIAHAAHGVHIERVEGFDAAVLDFILEASAQHAAWRVSPAQGTGRVLAVPERRDPR
jgi:hypothetical protein